MRDFFERNAKRFAAGSLGGFLASAALLAALFLGEALAGEEAYAGFGDALALLAVLGSAASAGYLAFVVARLFDGELDLWQAGSFSSKTSFSGAGRSGGEDWPLLVTLLFRKIPVLFAGLAGWVEARA